MTAEEYNNMSNEERLRYWAENRKYFTETTLTPGAVALARALGMDAPSEENDVTTFPELDVQASEPEMRLFLINGAYFDTKEEMESYAETEGLDVSKFSVVEYIRFFAGRSDVIRETDASGVGLCFKVCDEDGFGIYNRERSNREQGFFWEYSGGNIADIYAAFRERGIVFEYDIYGKIEEEKQRSLELCQKDNLMNLGKQSNN
ncbi:MAG: hypothetical protein K2L98_03310 [Bacilli bacterium]|nr:hypothetical protein [Bacilli bacterium]